MNVRLDTRACIEYPYVTGQDASFGTDIVEWRPLATVWMEVQDAMPSRSEAVRTGIAEARNQTRCRYRYRTDVTSAMRIRISGAVERVLQIVGGPAELGRHEYSEVMCEAVTP